MRFVIVTGMSGGGKSTALKMLEDIGFYCVDNLPVSLIEKFVELILTPGNEITRVALGLDVRAGNSLEDVEGTLDKLKGDGRSFEILYMHAGDATLIKRYKATRRMHPLSPEGRIEEGIERERKMLAGMRRRADYIIDTSHLLTRDLKEEMDRIFVRNEKYNSLIVTILSFGFKNGIPSDADLVFDVRFLPNPFYVDELKYKTGNDKEVQDFCMNYEETHIFLDKTADMLDFLIPNYVKEGKYQLVIGIGCTGGRHRSVTMANALYGRLKGHGNYGVKLYHRDVEQGYNV